MKNYSSKLWLTRRQNETKTDLWPMTKSLRILKDMKDMNMQQRSAKETYVFQEKILGLKWSTSSLFFKLNHNKPFTSRMKMCLYKSFWYSDLWVTCLHLQQAQTMLVTYVLIFLQVPKNNLKKSNTKLKKIGFEKKKCFRKATV